MAPFLETVKSFADVPISDQGIDTLAFLEASEGVVRLFKLLDNPAFGPVVSDLNGNITKIRTRYDAYPAQSTTLQLLIQAEQADKKQPTTEGLLWLLRGLLFTHQALHAAQSDPTLELSKAFTTGYEASLKKHHSFVVKGIFTVAMKACPYRKDFYAKLAADPDGGVSASVAGDQVNDALNKWLVGLNTIVVQMQKVYKDKGQEI